MSPVLRGVGFLLHVPAAMAVVSLLVCLLAGEWFGIYGFLLTLAATLIPGQLLVWTTRNAPPAQRFHAMRIAASAWVLISVAGGLPFALSATFAPTDTSAEALAVFHQPVMALFESVSGFTSTGLSVAPSPSALPHHIQWWRSFTEWVGGIGVVLLLLTVLPAERSSLYLYFSEAREEKILPTVKSTVRAIWALFTGYTVLAVAALWAAGEPWWRALNHGMTAIATGGFSITDDSLASTPPLVQLVYVPLMLLGAISFLIHYRVIRAGEWRAVLRDSSELRLFAALVVGGALALGLERWWFSGETQWLSAVVQWVSALTTTGFANEALGDWSPTPLLYLIFAMLIGAMAGSTGSGIKQARIAILLHDLAGSLRNFRATTHEVVRVRFNGQRVSPTVLSELARTASLLGAIYLLVWGVGVVALLHVVPAAVPLEHIFFEAASAQGNVGLSTGIVGAELSNGAALVLMLLMLTGRLEIFPVLLLVAWLFHPPRQQRSNR